ncbi:MAG TPA: DUF4129 domain-containing protein [Pyrinomonadaceae bacterium]|nr:DUF4129 domain-containing protein [Pyrinomonadaceae bacterium]
MTSQRISLIITRLIPATALVLLLAMQALPASIQGYRERVDSALKKAIEVEEHLIESDRNLVEAKVLVNQLRKDFPASERIEWDGGSVEISNEWILERAGELETLSDPKKSLAITTSIREYLDSLVYKLQQIDQARADSRSKDEDKQKLAEILRREEYMKPEEAGESVIQRWLRSFVEWLMDLWPRPSNPADSLSAMDGLISVLRILLYFSIAGILVFLIYKVAPLLMPRFRRNKKPKKKKRVILGEQIAEDQAASDLFNEAERLAREGDLRSAIRKGYIALLCDLSDRRIIGLARSKTNRDYVRDVRSRRDLHARMQSATDMFERHWYGYQESQPTDWARFSEEYREAIRSA